MITPIVHSSLKLAWKCLEQTQPPKTIEAVSRIDCQLRAWSIRKRGHIPYGVLAWLDDYDKLDMQVQVEDYLKASLPPD